MTLFYLYNLIMKFERILVKLLGLLMLAYFVNDAYHKYVDAGEQEGEKIKIKLQQFDNWIRDDCSIQILQLE